MMAISCAICERALLTATALRAAQRKHLSWWPFEAKVSVLQLEVEDELQS
jgi:hypothetical protein